MRFLGKALLSVAGMAGVSATAAYTRLNTAIREKVQSLASQAAGARVTLREVGVSPLSGSGHIRGLVLANPEGFKSENALRVDEIRVRLAPSSLLTSTIIVHELVLDTPLLTWELGKGGGNLAQIHKALGAAAKPKGKRKKAAAPVEGRRLVVENFIVRNGRLRVAAAGIGGPLFLPLPDLHLRDLGKKEGGATLQEIVALALDAVIRSGLDTAGGAGNALRTAGKAASQALGKLFGN